MTDNIVHKMQSAYSNGKLITDDQWEYLNKMYKKLKRVDRKEKYLKSELEEIRKSGTVEYFLGSDLEEFYILTKNVNILYTVLMDVEDYLKFASEDPSDNDSIFSNTVEALEAVKKAFKKLDSIKEEVAEYLIKDFD